LSRRRLKLVLEVLDCSAQLADLARLMLVLEVCNFSAQLLHFIAWRRCLFFTRSPVLFVWRRFLVLLL
jgi:hypothetical protein